MNKKKENICKNCKNWKNQQAEIEYSTHYGFCVSSKLSYSFSGTADCQLLDRDNKTISYLGTSRFECLNSDMPLGSVDESRYVFVTEEEYGCVNFKKQ